MDFEVNEIGLPYPCPECNGTGRKPYGICAKCQGAGYLIKAILTYGEDYNTAGQPARRMFGGYISIEKPPVSEPLDSVLPTAAVNKGYGLSWWSRAVFGADPVILYKNRWEVYRWEYIPSMTEVWEKIGELEITPLEK